MTHQLELFTVRKRTRRSGRVLVPLGRRPRPEREGFMPHGVREAHDERHPVHVTMRRVALAPSFRAERVSRAIVVQLARASAQSTSNPRGIRVVHYSIQHDHLHLMLEGTDRHHLSRQAQKLFSRIALAVNAVAGRRGSLFRDRHHRHELKTPTEVRRALVYILFNSRKHGGRDGLGNPRMYRWFDSLTSAAWFTAWHPRAGPTTDATRRAQDEFAGLHPTVRPETWLAREGWKRAGGPLRFDEVPRVV